MARPDDLPDWATSGATVAPSLGKRAAGWLVGEKPGAQFFNWWQNLVGKWTEYLDDERAAAVERLDAFDAFDLRVALKDEPNTFVGGQTIDVSDTSQPVLTSELGPHDSPLDSANAWKTLIRFPCVTVSGTTRYLHICSGDGTHGYFAIVVNARWRTNTQVWRQEDHDFVSHALMIGSDGTLEYFATPAHATTDWLDWPTTTGSLSVATVNANAVSATASVGGVTGVYAGGVAGNFNFAPTKTRPPMPVPLGDGSNNFVAAIGAEYGAKEGSSGSQHYPLRFPENCGGAAIEIMFKQSSSLTSFFDLEKHDADWSGLTLDSASLDSGTTPAASGVGTLTLTVPAIVAGSEYRLRWAPGAPADLLYAVRVTSLQDNGPRNTF